MKCRCQQKKGLPAWALTLFAGGEKPGRYDDDRIAGQREAFAIQLTVMSLEAELREHLARYELTMPA